MTKYTETDLELATLEWLEELGYSVVGGPEIAPPPDGERPERKSYADVVLEGRLWLAIDKFNPDIPRDAKEEAFKKVVQVAHATPNLTLNNKIFHSYLRDGVDAEYMRSDLPASRPGLFFVYAILCDNDSIYIGQTDDIENRWKLHEQGKAAKHTKKYKPRMLIHY